MIPSTFITKASDILGKTTGGLTGSKITSICSSFAYDFGVSIPHSSSPTTAANKRTALRENLLCFTAEQQFQIIKEMCEHDDLKGDSQVRDLKIKLISRFGHLSEDLDSVNEVLIDETRHWLHGYGDSLKLYEEALQKFNNSIFERNLLDDLRLALEKLIQGIFGIAKSLENQLGDLGSFIRQRGGSKELANMFQKLVEYYTKYQNTYVKHNDQVKEEEIEFIFEITSSFMKHFIRLNK